MADARDSDAMKKSSVSGWVRDGVLNDAWAASSASCKAGVSGKDITLSSPKAWDTVANARATLSPNERLIMVVADEKAVPPNNIVFACSDTGAPAPDDGTTSGYELFIQNFCSILTPFRTVTAIQEVTVILGP
jgi:hypothetical protein